MTPRVRALTAADRDATLNFLAQRPVENLFLASKVATFGIDRRRVGQLYAYERDGEITSVMLDGGTIFVAGFDPHALPAFVGQLGPIRRCSSILGPAVSVLGLFLGLAERWKGSWGNVSNVRKRQPLMLLEQAPAVDQDPRVRLLTEDDYSSYLDASVHMYTDEIGSSPFKYGSGYERFVLQRLRDRDAYGIVEDGKVIFKADLGPKWGDQAQLQGVWVDPALRGQGISVPALSAMMHQAMDRFPRISLYVNDFNTPAIRSYEHLGFREVGALATVHY
ncbi:MAG TPA: GNAT family N-acetyltransferase [Tessaracoccus flavescens]|uniref:GNAT family N-acetyltransferase n=1 Tax=Tessaracoccus flavescens TaxID=399497 RepID=A0A921EL20_9ACTN|nr:GNAT family N-acetyltransferase [Tessaracoccus flavescens]